MAKSNDITPTLDTDEAWEQLLMMRSMTKITNALSDAQILQLKLWPLLAAPHATSSECTWNAIKKEVDFTLKLGKQAPPEDLEARFEGLDRSIKAMLGGDWLVRVRAKGNVIFRGRRQVVKVEDKDTYGAGATPKQGSRK